MLGCTPCTFPPHTLLVVNSYGERQADGSKRGLVSSATYNFGEDAAPDESQTRIEAAILTPRVDR